MERRFAASVLPLQQFLSRLWRDSDTTNACTIFQRTPRRSLGQPQRRVPAPRFRDVCELVRLYALVDFFAVHSYLLGRCKTEADLVAPDAQHSDSNVITDLY